MDDVIIAGAGFAGLACAQSAARRGLRVRVLERKAAVGANVHTTGLLVKEAAQEWEIPGWLTRKIHGVRLYSPSLQSVDIESPGYYFLATDTGALLRWFAREAQRCGALIGPGSAYCGAERSGDGLRLHQYGLKTAYLVGADGPQSMVARDFGLSTNSRFLLGLEAELQGVSGLEPDRLHCFVDSKLAPGYIGWAIPGVGGITQIGLACRRPYRPDLRAFIHKLEGLFDFSAARVQSKRGGLIPVGGRVSRFSAPNVLLIGDAAGLVSPLTAGGIHNALESGWYAGHAIADHILDGGVDPGRTVAARYPSFFWKRWLRRGLDCDPPNVVYDWALSTPMMRSLARLIHFHKRGLWSAQAWREILGRDGPVTSI
jgi:digeranylgeranylglycerophospholipid reductase